MDKYQSYTEFLKAIGRTQSTSEAEKLLNEIYLDLFLSHVHHVQREEQLLALIDRALDEKNKKAFYRYATELEQLQKISV